MLCIGSISYFEFGDACRCRVAARAEPLFDHSNTTNVNLAAVTFAGLTSFFFFVRTVGTFLGKLGYSVGEIDSDYVPPWCSGVLDFRRGAFFVE